jgi:hypothetical protein
MEVATFLAVLGAGMGLSSLGGDKTKAAPPAHAAQREGFASGGGGSLLAPAAANDDGGVPTGFIGTPLLPDNTPAALPRVQPSLVAGAVTPAPRFSEDADANAVSALSGLPIHSVMPSFRGTPKQPTSDTAFASVLDNYTGGGATTVTKREQAPMFRPQQAMGRPLGTPAVTDFMESRVVAPRNRAGQRPVDPVSVAPGLGLGYTASGAGGYQQLSVNEFARPRSTDELRPANRPKVTYAQPVVKGAHFVPLAVNKDELGSGTQARPPRYYSNPSGERNFVTTGDTVAPARRGAVVLQDVTRPETTTPYGGVAGLVDGGASYEVPSTHAPMHRQHGPYGWRNADASTYGDADTSKFANDHGRSGVHFDANQRSVTGTRVVPGAPKEQEAGMGPLPVDDPLDATRKDEVLGNPREAGNVGGAVTGQSGFVHDPDDVARTTVKETTADSSWLGMVAGAAAAALKAMVADPEVNRPRVTTRETTADSEWLGQATTAGVTRHTVVDPTDTARTTIRETTGDDGWLGAAAPATAGARLAVYDPDDVARTTTRETLAPGDTTRNLAGAAVGGAAAALPLQDRVRTTLREQTTDGSDYVGGVMGGADNSQPSLPLQDGARKTQKAALSATSAYTGAAGSAMAKAEMSQAAERAIRTNSLKESIAKGRAPRGSSVKMPTSIAQQGATWYRRPAAASVNSRKPVPAPTPLPAGVGALGVMQPRIAANTEIAYGDPQADAAVLSQLRTNPLSLDVRTGGTPGVGQVLPPPQIAGGAPQRP